jgi:hypothetical protein
LVPIESTFDVVHLLEGCDDEMEPRKAIKRAEALSPNPATIGVV